MPIPLQRFTAVHSTAALLFTALVFYWLHFQSFLQVTSNHVILCRFLKRCRKWRHLHERQPPDRRGWSVYPSFSFQILLLTMLNTAETQALGKGKGKGDNCRTHRTRDGLMVQYRWAIIVKYLSQSYLFFYYRF